jgi:acyl-coenzyme A synthetase/AMP-(fatty) acid ligase
MEDGNVYCLGRRDNQVNLRGQRIELKEIEKFISSIPKVQSTVVLLVKTKQFEAICAMFSRRGKPDLEIPSAILKPDKQTIDLTSRLDDLLRVHLPQYAVPRYWVPLSRVPSDTNSKMDRSSVRTTITAMSKGDLAYFAIQKRHFRGIGHTLESKNEKVIRLQRSTRHKGFVQGKQFL